MDIKAKNLGLQIYAADSILFPDAVTYELLMYDKKSRKYKYTYSVRINLPRNNFINTKKKEQEK